jgi:hypothetical protein
MGKIAFDKYYTSPIVARWCIEKTKEIIGEENITEWYEPSAGSGSFSHQIPGCKAYDLYPQHEYIEQADFIESKLEYKKGRCFIGNPPFGSTLGKLIKQFYDKSCDCGDYIAYIQPAAYYNNYSSFHRFEIVYSCLLKTDYTNVKLWTSFTIYKRNPDRDNFKEKKETFQDFTLTKINRTNKGKMHKKHLDYDYCFTSFGGMLRQTEPYQTSGQFILKCHNPENKDLIISTIKWLYYYNKETDIFSNKCVSTEDISYNSLIKVLKICIPGLK